MTGPTFTIDWEDFGQLYSMYHYGKVTPPSEAIDRQTNVVLDLLEESDVKGTFFILGMLATYKPDLVRKIQARGHEIALHGQNHKHMFLLNREEALKDITTSLNIVQEITGAKIYGFRAPFFSINHSNLYLLDMLAELGFEYDSSVRSSSLGEMSREGIGVENSAYTLPNGKELVELPVTGFVYWKKNLLSSGGGYLRVLPDFILSKMFRNMESNGTDPMIYLHPYEFDPHPLDVSANYPNGAVFSKFKNATHNLKWNFRRSSVTTKIRRLLKQHKFVTCKEKVNYVKSNGNSPVLLGRAK